MKSVLVKATNDLSIRPSKELFPKIAHGVNQNWAAPAARIRSDGLFTLRINFCKTAFERWQRHDHGIRRVICSRAIVCGARTEGTIKPRPSGLQPHSTHEIQRVPVRIGANAWDRKPATRQSRTTRLVGAFRMMRRRTRRGENTIASIACPYSSDRPG